MFVVTTLVDVIRIPPSLLGGTSCRAAVISEIDHTYPNKVLLGHGLVVARYGEVKLISNGVCVAGDGGSHHTCQFSLVLFKPFLEEVVVGRITKSDADGVHVSLGFFDNVFIPAYWMLRPSVYEPELGLWVWTPQYDDDDDEDEADGIGETAGGVVVKKEPATSEEPQRFEMELHAEIRFKVKSIQYTQLTKTVKGLQATTTTDDSAAALAPALTSTASGGGTTTTSTGLVGPRGSESITALGPIRRQRSSTMDDNSNNAGSGASSQGQPPMYIIGSICEDGLGLTSWWTNAEDGDDNDDDDDNDDGVNHEEENEADEVQNGDEGEDEG